MPVNYRISLKTSRMTAVRDDIDSGAGAGILDIGTGANAAAEEARFFVRSARVPLA